MRAGDPVQLPRQHATDGRLLLVRPIFDKTDLTSVLPK
jgi:hypothetical protein